MSEVEDDLLLKKLKIVLVGDSGCGKTSIAMKFCFNEFTRQYTPTSGIDFFLKHFCVNTYKNINLHLWDVDGLALRSSLMDNYIYHADIILMVYDITNISSFTILEQWLDKIHEIYDETGGSATIAVVGNKCDMEHQRTVKRDHSHRFAAANGFNHYDISARTGESVSLCMASLTAQILGLKLTKTEREYHKPIIVAEIGDTVDMNIPQKVVKRQPNKKNTQVPIASYIPLSRSSVCALQ